jgi:hypothetical protein
LAIWRHNYVFWNVFTFQTYVLIFYVESSYLYTSLICVIMELDPLINH